MATITASDSTGAKLMNLPDDCPQLVDGHKVDQQFRKSIAHKVSSAMNQKLMVGLTSTSNGRARAHSLRKELVSRPYISNLIE